MRAVRGGRAKKYTHKHSRARLAHKCLACVSEGVATYQRSVAAVSRLALGVAGCVVSSIFCFVVFSPFSTLFALRISKLPILDSNIYTLQSIIV